MCRISKVFAINEIKKTKQICLSNKESISDHRCERKNVVAKIKTLATVTLHLMGNREYKCEYQTRNTKVIIDGKGKWHSSDIKDSYYATEIYPVIKVW